jgi:amino acid transporter
MSETEPLSQQAPDVRHRLSRKLSTFGNLAITYSGVGAAAGIYSLFGFSMGFSGATMVWGWVIVGLAMGLMSLLFAELSSHYPYAGAVYQWSSILAGRRVGWWVGWIYLFGILFTLTSYYFVLPGSVIPLLGLSGSQAQIVAIVVICLAVATICNAAGIQVLGRLNRYGVLLEMGVFFVITILVTALAPVHHGLGVLTNTLGTSSGVGSWLNNFMAGGIFVSLWVLFSFENGGTLGEETVDAHRKAPRAVIGAWLVTFIAGLAFILAILTAIPDLATVNKTGVPIQDAIGSALGDGGSRFYLGLIAVITLLGGTAFFAGAVRHAFSMARDGMLPGSQLLSRTSPKTGAPMGAIIVIAVVTAIPLIASRTIAVLVTGAVAVMYVAYFLITIVLLRARLRGWPQQTSPFTLGRWGLPLNVLAIAFTGVMMVNLLWPRDATNPEKWGLPVAWWLLGIPIVVGLAYFAAIVKTRLHGGSGEGTVAAQSGNAGHAGSMAAEPPARTI